MEHKEEMTKEEMDANKKKMDQSGKMGHEDLCKEMCKK